MVFQQSDDRCCYRLQAFYNSILVSFQVTLKRRFQLLANQRERAKTELTFLFLENFVAIEIQYFIRIADSQLRSYKILYSNDNTGTWMLRNRYKTTHYWCKLQDSIETRATGLRGEKSS